MNPPPISRDTILLHPLVRAAVLATLDGLRAQGIPFALFEGWRAPERQRWLYQQGRTRPGSKVTKARAWESLHQYGLAADLVLRVDGQWSWAGEAAQWERMHAIGRANGLAPLSWEAPHLQFAGAVLADLRAGRLPGGGDETWRAGLYRAAAGWPGIAPALVAAVGPPEKAVIEV